MTILGGLLLCIFSAEARFFGHLNEMENPGVPVLQPDQVLPIGPNGVGDIAMSTDGQHLVYTDWSHQFDIWLALVWFWPGITSVLLGLALPICLPRFIRRRVRMPKESGPFCRKCAYPSHGHQSDVCPECGKPLCGKKSIDPGVTRLRTWTHCLTSTVLVSLVIALLWTIQLPRFGWVSGLIDWRSEPLAIWVLTNQNQSLEPYVIGTTAIRYVELTDPTDVKTIAHVRYATPEGLSDRLYPPAVPNSSRLNYYETLQTNQAQTRASVQTESCFAAIDLERLKRVDAGEMYRHDYARHTSLSADGKAAMQMFFHGSNDRGMLIDIDGSKARDVPKNITETKTITVNTRYTSPSDRKAKISKGIEPDPLPPFTAQALKVQTTQLGDEQFQQLEGSPFANQLVGDVQAGLLILVALDEVLLYDLENDKWVAVLDIRQLGGVDSTDGVQVAVAADRSIAAVLSKDQYQVATFVLPESVRR